MIHVALSGGLDSTVLAASYVHDGEEVSAVAFLYGQRHASRELAAAADVADDLRIPLTIIPIPDEVLRSPALIGDAPTPEGHYLDPAMADTVVPGRNLLFASLLVSRASDGDTVALGIQGGEGSFYPDCRPTFLDPLRDAVRAAYGVTIDTPLGTMTKDAVVREGVLVGAPMALTWSCYGGGTAHCGRCGTCVKRAEAFHVAGVPDPTRYDDPDYWKAAAL